MKIGNHGWNFHRNFDLRSWYLGISFTWKEWYKSIWLGFGPFDIQLSYYDSIKAMEQIWRK